MVFAPSFPAARLARSKCHRGAVLLSLLVNLAFDALSICIQCQSRLIFHFLTQVRSHVRSVRFQVVGCSRCWHTQGLLRLVSGFALSCALSLRYFHELLGAPTWRGCVARAAASWRPLIVFVHLSEGCTVINNRELPLICPNPLVAHNTNGDIMLTTKCTSVQRASVRRLRQLIHISVSKAKHAGRPYSPTPVQVP